MQVRHDHHSSEIFLRSSPNRGLFRDINERAWTEHVDCVRWDVVWDGSPMGGRGGRIRQQWLSWNIASEKKLLEEVRKDPEIRFRCFITPIRDCHPQLLPGSTSGGPGESPFGKGSDRGQGKNRQDKEEYSQDSRTTWTVTRKPLTGQNDFAHNNNPMEKCNGRREGELPDGACRICFGKHPVHSQKNRSEFGGTPRPQTGPVEGKAGRRVDLM